MATPSNKQYGIDLAEGARCVSAESFGDWYRDPWGWPEFGQSFSEKIQLSDLRVAPSNRDSPLDLPIAFHSFDMPKSYLGVRPAVVQDPLSRLLYTSAALSIAKDEHANLPDWVYGWRFRDNVLTKTTDEWTLYSESRATASEQAHSAQTDITSCFASIRVESLLDQVSGGGGRTFRTGAIRAVVEAHDRLPHRSGLPQRSTASSLLAQYAFAPIDDLLHTAISSGHIQSARRWMDDISFEGPEASVVRLLRALQEKGREVGLEINASKTRITLGAELAEANARENQKLIRVQRLTERTGPYEDHVNTYLDDSELLEAEAEILTSPQSTSRTEVGLVLRSLNYYANFDRADEWARAARYLPHAADHLSRFLAHVPGDDWPVFDPEEWFLTEHSSDWPYLEWVSAQHALSLPSKGLSQATNQIFQGWITNSSNLQQVAVAVQRLASSDPRLARSTISSRIKSTHDPLILRVLALGHVAAEGSTTLAENALARVSTNHLTLAAMKALKWQLPRVRKDFDPSEDDSNAVPD